MTIKAKRAATKRIHLTERRIAALSAPAKRVTVYDLKQGELGLKTEPSGRKVFFWFRAFRGKPTWKMIGEWPAIGLDAARRKAQEFNVTLAEDDGTGPNPFHTPRRGQQPTLGILINDYLDRHTLLHAANPEKAAKGIRWTAKRYLMGWENRRLNSITRQDVFDLHKKLGAVHGKVAANRTVTLLRTLFNWARGDAGLWTGENPASRMKPFDEIKRERYLQPDELLNFTRALDAERHIDLKDFVILALATGARKSNIHAMRWSDVNLETETWTIARTKNKKPHLVDLSPAAVAALTSRLERRRDDSPWIFPSFGVSGHTEGFKKPWKALLKRAGLYYPHDARRVAMHDLRRTRASYMAIGGASLQHIGGVLGHLSASSTSIYAKLHREATRNAIAVGDETMRKMMRSAQKQLSASV